MSVFEQGKAIRHILMVALAVILVFSLNAVPVLSVVAEATADGGDAAASLNPNGYEAYLAKYPDAKAASATSKVVILAGAQGAYEANAAASVERITKETNEGALALGDYESALLLKEDKNPDEIGAVTFKFTVPETALYSVNLVYHGFNASYSKGSTIERRMLVDGAVPYEEAEYLTLRRVFKDVYRLDDSGNRLKDINGNDIRPSQEEVFTWISRDLYDAEGYLAAPMQFYLEAGEHSITLESRREAMLLYSITLFGQQPLPTYAEVEKTYQQNGYKQAATSNLFIQAEDIVLKSEKSNYPLCDRSSAGTMPQDPFVTKLNYIGGEKWQSSGSWVEWTVTPEQTGLYAMTLRYKQDIYSGVKISRRLTIDGEVPFAEAEAFTFDYNNAWTNVTLSDDSGKPYYFYFEAGRTYTLRMEAVLGDMGKLLNRVSDVMTKLNADYRTILMITGSTPDKYRSYRFEELIPETLADMATQAAELEDIVNGLVELTGEKGERVATLEKMSTVVRQMTDDPFVIAAKFSMFKDNLSALGTWILESASQPMKLDYIALTPDVAKAPKAGGGFFPDLWFGVQNFLSSFVTDYQSVGATASGLGTGSSITVWVTSGRDQANIIRTLIDTTFTPYSNITVNLQLVSAAAVLPCVLAGRGPDVCLGVAKGEPVNYAVRDAVIALEEMEGFNEVIQRFNPNYEAGEGTTSSISALIPYTYEGKTFALPETEAFNMMFVRTDIFTDLNLKVPETWEDLELLIPELQKRNMYIGLGHDLGALLMFMYQQGVPLYLGDRGVDEGKAANLDSSTAVQCFTKMCEYFTLYGFPTDYDAANRFRSGEVPLMICDYGLYNQLSLFAPEIRGDWAMYQIPGTVQEDGSINNAQTTGGSAVVMMRGCEDQKAAWEFMQWWTSEDTMLNYGNEMETAMNGAARQAVANVKALNRMAWSTKDLNNIMGQWKSVVGTPEVPGSYYTVRVLGFAFAEAYNNSTDPGDALQKYISSLNAELTRKRAEFGR